MKSLVGATNLARDRANKDQIVYQIAIAKNGQYIVDPAPSPAWKVHSDVCPDWKWVRCTICGKLAQEHDWFGQLEGCSGYQAVRRIRPRLESLTVEQIRGLRDWVMRHTEDPKFMVAEHPEEATLLLTHIVYDSFPRLATYTLQLLGEKEPDID